MRASLYTRLASGLIFPLHERLKGHDTVAVRKRMEETQWWDAERLEALRLERLQALLDHALVHVPYYRERFASEGIQAGDVRSLKDLAKLPFLDKPAIRANRERLKSDQARGLSRFNTGGSSGEPLIFYIGKERVSHDVAAKWRATRWWDVDIGDPEVVIWGSPIELGAQDRVRLVRDRLLRTRLLPAFEMSDAKVDGFIERIRRMRPRMLFGYPSALSHIAARAEYRCVPMDDLGIRVAFVTSEMLYDEQKQRIERVFGCPVANGYGGRDAGFIAHQCPEGSMHITAEDIIVETVDAAGRPCGPGQAGEIVVTHLATRDYPFIRYRTGDVGVLTDERCPCGRGLPLLKEIQGRTTDFIVALDGTVMHGLALIYILRDLPEIRSFKIIQESLDLTRVQTVCDGPLGEATAAIIRKGFRDRLGEGVEVRIEQVDGILAERSGKFRYVVSKVSGETSHG
jgi:phenylacetate-CoA ligase